MYKEYYLCIKINQYTLNYIIFVRLITQTIRIFIEYLVKIIIKSITLLNLKKKANHEIDLLLKS